MKRTFSFLTVFLSLVAVSVPTVASASSVLPGVVNGTAYAGYLVTPIGSSIASIGPLFIASLGCNYSPQTITSSAVSMGLANFAQAGSLTDQVTTTHSSTDASVQASSTISTVSVLNGLIQVGTMSVSANSTATTTGASSSGSATLTNVVVNSNHISVTPGLTITLPNLGYVILDEQVGSSNGNHASFAVFAVDVHIQAPNNGFGLPIGTRLIIGYASTDFTRSSIPIVASSSSYGLYVNGLSGPNSTSSGPWAWAGSGCTGGSSNVSLTSLTISGIGSIGTMTDSASAQLSTAGSDATAQSTIQKVNLLSGLIQIDTLTSESDAKWTGSGSRSGSTVLTGITIAGILKLSNLDPAPNTHITLPGIGYIVLNEQVSGSGRNSAYQITNALDVHVTADNTLSLPGGLTIIVGHTYASVINYG